MNIQMIQVPYDSGHKDVRAGRGPGYFLQRGLDQTLRGDGHQVDVQRIESQAALTTEIGTALELNRLLARQVHAATSKKMFPLVLAGNCNSSLGTLAGIEPGALGVIWFDAHGDFNTPETTLSGFFDGMGLAMAAGRCWRALLETIPGFHPIPEANILHIGARDLDPEEAKLMQRSEMQVVRPGAGEDRLRREVEAALDTLRDQVSGVYVHVDVDVLDTGEALPNHFAVPGGLPVELVEEIIGMTRERFELRAGAVTCFEPEYDKGDQVLNAGVRIVKALVA